MKRFYRNQIKSAGKFSFNVIIEESDLFIVCDRNLEEQAYLALEQARRKIKKYIAAHPEFRDSLVPVDVYVDEVKFKENIQRNPESNSGHLSGKNILPVVHSIIPNVSPIVNVMADAARLYDVGPMAAVAGAVAGYVGGKLLQECTYIMIENGGDIFLKSDEPITLGVWAGENSPFNGKLTLRIAPEGKPVGICTSSGMFGHSLSFGKADAVVTIAQNPALADAAATAIANKVQSKEDIQPLADMEQEKGLLDGLIIIKDDRAAMWGDFELV